MKVLVRSDNYFRRTGRLYKPETECHEKIVLKIKSIVMRTTNSLFRKVRNYIHFMGWFAEFERKCNILEIFHYFQYFERFRSMKKWQISKPKIVDWYLDFTKESYTTLKSVISSFEICLQNYGQLKRKFLRPKNTSSTFLKFELSSLRGPMLKTRKNTVRNQFKQQWFDGDGDCVTFYRLTAYHLFLASYFDETMIKFWNLLHETYTLIYDKNAFSK